MVFWKEVCLALSFCFSSLILFKSVLSLSVKELRYPEACVVIAYAWVIFGVLNEMLFLN